MEYLDIYDEEGKKIGVKPRQDVHKDGDWHKVAYVFVVNDKGEVILQRRSKEKESAPNKWEVSASGHLSAGDTDIEGAIRELEEELGIKATEDELQYLFTIKEQRFKTDRKTSHISIIYILFKNIDIQDLVLQKEEVSDAKYVYYKDLEKMITEGRSDLISHDEIYAALLKELHKRFD